MSYFYFKLDEEPAPVREFRLRTWKRRGMRAGYLEASWAVKAVLAIAWLGGLA